MPWVPYRDSPLPRSGEYTNILVVVCALTRFTLYIPVPNVTAAETQKALMTHVFSIFGFPLVIVSDNGPAFRSNLQKKLPTSLGSATCLFYLTTPLRMAPPKLL